MSVDACCNIYGEYFLDKTFPNPKVNSPLGLYLIVCTSHLWQSIKRELGAHILDIFMLTFKLSHV